MVDSRRHRPRAVAPVGGARAPARRPAGALAMGLGERRGLPEAGPPRGIELIGELLVPAFQPIALTLGAPQRVAQLGDLFLLLFDQRVAIGRRRGVSATHWLCQNRVICTSTKYWIDRAHPLRPVKQRPSFTFFLSGPRHPVRGHRRRCPGTLVRKPPKNQGVTPLGAHVTEVAARTLRRCDVAFLRI